MKLFRHPEILTEGYAEVNLTTRQVYEKQRIKKRIDSYIRDGYSGIVGLIGLFGSGKSTVVDHIISDDIEHKYRWLKFDIWRYADRQQIWDGFVIEVIAALSTTGETKYEKETKVANRLEGEHPFSLKIKQHKYSFLIGVIAVWLLLSAMVWFGTYLHDDATSLFIKALLKYGVSILFVALAFLGLNSVLSRSNPLKRLFEFEKELEKSLLNIDKPLVIVVEDVDRASEEGVVFMETLKELLGNLNKKSPKHPVVVIAPQSKIYLDAASANTLQGFERGIKIYDSVIHYAGSVLKTQEVIEVIKKAGLDPSYSKQFTMVAMRVLDTYRKNLSMRTVKFVLREVDEFMKAYPKANPSLVFILIMARYIKITVDNRQEAALTYLSSKKYFSTTNSRDDGVLALLCALCALVDESADPKVSIELDFNDTPKEIDGTINIQSRLTIDNKYDVLMER